jgi:transcriptional regulator with XRE-family HTH domain
VNKQTTGPALADLRKARHLSREQLAALAGVSAATVYRIERGRVTPLRVTVAALRAALDDERPAHPPASATAPALCMAGQDERTG